jgi:hypothetical protein
MREMFRTIFSSITSFFRAIEKGSETLENCAKWAECESAAFEEEARFERNARINLLQEKLQLVELKPAETA